LRLLLSDTYKKKTSKSKSLLPKINTQEEAITAFRLLQASLLTLRVEKVSAHHGHDHDTPEKPPKDPSKKKKKKSSTDKPKPAQNLSIQRDQSSFSEQDYFAWFYETTQLQTILGGIGVVVVVFGAILFPLWPPMMRTGVWYLSIALLGLIAAIAVIAVVRLILFVITMFAVPPGIWLFPNLFEDVGFFESFVPLWGWQKVPKGKKKKQAVGGTAGKGKGVETAAVVTGEKSLHMAIWTA
jgi:translocation protein SEC62